MTTTQLAKRQDRAAIERLVIQQVEEGFRVYAAAEPKNRYIVSGSADAPQCTCPDFQYHQNDPDWQCKHILAVLNEFADIEVVAQNADTDEAEERRAIQEESRGPRTRQPAHPNGNGGGNAVAQLLLKRSVSPDGRIDSLSVEFSSPVDGLAGPEIHARAERMLRLQSGIVAQFLDRQKRTNGNGEHERANGTANRMPPRSAQASSNGQSAARRANGSGPEPAVPATLVDVAGMNGKWGRRLFINVEANGKTLKLFGKVDELVEHIRAAGYIAPDPFCEGAVLNIPCAVITKPSPDGRYTNVEQVLPANQPASRPQPVRRIGQ